MAYDQTSRSYKMTDEGGNYDWICEGLDIRDYFDSTDEELGELVDTLIEQGIEEEISTIESESEDLVFPRFGYTTAQQFEDLESYLDWKREEIANDLRAERGTMIEAIKGWIDREWIEMRLGEPEEALQIDDLIVLENIEDEGGVQPSLDDNGGLVDGDVWLVDEYTAGQRDELIKRGAKAVTMRRLKDYDPSSDREILDKLYQWIGFSSLGYALVLWDDGSEGA